MNDYLRFWQVEESIFLRDLPDGSLFQTLNVRTVIPRLLHFAKENYPSVILLTGETGIGKTSFLRWLYFHLSAETHDIWYVPLLSLEVQKGWLIKKLARFLGVFEPGPIRLEDLLVKVASKLDQLIEERRRLLVLIDDAHFIAKEALSDLSTFLNLQSMGARCLSFVVSGEGNLEGQLAQNRGILSRVVMRYEFQPFTQMETQGYLQFRFDLSGRSNVFAPDAAREIHQLARGVPGLINILAENSLFDGFQKKLPLIDATIVREASYFLADMRLSTPSTTTISGVQESLDLEAKPKESRIQDALSHQEDFQAYLKTLMTSSLQQRADEPVASQPTIKECKVEQVQESMGKAPTIEPPSVTTTQNGGLPSTTSAPRVETNLDNPEVPAEPGQMHLSSPPKAPSPTTSLPEHSSPSWVSLLGNLAQLGVKAQEERRGTEAIKEDKVVQAAESFSEGTGDIREEGIELLSKLPEQRPPDPPQENIEEDIQKKDRRQRKAVRKSSEESKKKSQKKEAGDSSISLSSLFMSDQKPSKT